jgi:hypothetical protein
MSRATYQDRIRTGRPNVTITPSVKTLDLLSELCEALDDTRTGVIETAVRELYERLFARE